MGDYGFIDIVLFAMIAAFLILRLRSVLGKHRNSGEGKSNLGLHALTETQKTETDKTRSKPSALSVYPLFARPERKTFATEGVREASLSPP